MPSKLMFSDLRQLMCSTTDDINYYYLYGSWCGIREGNRFYTDKDKEYFIFIYDWVEYTRKELIKKYPKFGY